MSLFIINKVVIHYLVKAQHKDIEPSIIREEVLDPKNEIVIKTVNGVVDIYGTKNNSAHYGIFIEGEGRGAFPGDFEKYALLTNPNDDDFMNLTHTAMGRLYDKASANQATSGGYLLFADYINSQGRYYLIAMIKQKPGITLTDKLEPKELMQLDLSRLTQAARISFGKLDAYKSADETSRQELSYLSFVSPSSTKTASGYFVTALGCSAGVASAKATKMLITEARRLFRDNERLRPHEDEFNNSLLSYLNQKEISKDSVRLIEIENILRRHIPENMADEADTITNGFISHLNSEECGIPVEFPVSRTVLRKFTHISGETNKWKMTFDRTALGTSPAAEVYYEKETKKITFRNIPKLMIDFIEDELKDRDQSEGG